MRSTIQPKPRLAIQLRQRPGDQLEGKAEASFDGHKIKALIIASFWRIVRGIYRNVDHRSHKTIERETNKRGLKLYTLMLFFFIAVIVIVLLRGEVQGERGDKERRRERGIGRERDYPERRAMASRIGSSADTRLVSQNTVGANFVPFVCFYLLTSFPFFSFVFPFKLFPFKK